MSVGGGGKAVAVGSTAAMAAGSAHPVSAASDSSANPDTIAKSPHRIPKEVLFRMTLSLDSDFIKLAELGSIHPKADRSDGT